MSEREVAMRRENILALEGTPVLAERARPMTVEEFLDFAECREERYEFIDGEVYEMSNTRFHHNIICHNIGFLLGNALVSRNCQVLGTGQGVKISDTRVLVPDASVVCGEPHLEGDTRLLLNPDLVVEITSPSTASFDRGFKRECYFEVPSIQAYLIVEQERPLVELHTRGRTGWQIRSSTGMDDDAPLDALDCRLPLREIYANVEFEAASDE